MHLARTVRALEQLLPDIGGLAETSHDHDITRLSKGGITTASSACATATALTLSMAFW